MNINKYGKALSWITRPKSTETATLENFNPEELRTPFRGAGLVDHGPAGVRQGYAGEKVKHLGEGLYETTYKGGSKSYFGQVMRKGENIKFNSKDKTEVLDFLEKQKTVKKGYADPLLEKPKYKNALEQALDEVYKMEEKGYGALRELTQK